MKKILFLFSLLLIARYSYSQPDTDIFVFEMRLNNENIALTDGKNITNRKGYDNQPYFFNNNELFFTAATEEGQTEIFKIRLDKGKLKQITQTSESEYSPTPIPEAEFFSVIQVEKDGVQRLWKFSTSPKSKEEAKLLLENIKPVGYHVWDGPDKLAMFVLGEPNTLQTAKISTGQATKLAENVGRCFKNIPNSKLVSFVHKISEKKWEIKSLNISNSEVKTLLTTIEGCEDYEWVSESTIIMGKGSKLYKYSIGKDTEWQEVGDLSMFGIYNFNRLAASPDKTKLAIVATEFDEE